MRLEEYLARRINKACGLGVGVEGEGNVKDDS